MASLVVIRRRLERNSERLELYYEAERAILDGAQSYTIGTRNLTRANLAEITDMIAALAILNPDWDALERQMAGDGAAGAPRGRHRRRNTRRKAAEDW